MAKQTIVEHDISYKLIMSICMPEPTSLLTYMCGVFLIGMTRKAADRYGDGIFECLEDNAKEVVGAVKEGIARDYEAGGIFAQFNDIYMQNI
jgi:hypothetical protein